VTGSQPPQNPGQTGFRTLAVDLVGLADQHQGPGLDGKPTEPIRLPTKAAEEIGERGRSMVFWNTSFKILGNGDSASYDAFSHA